jgi:hypothetical protein
LEFIFEANSQLLPENAVALVASPGNTLLVPERSRSVSTPATGSRVAFILEVLLFVMEPAVPRQNVAIQAASYFELSRARS